MSPPSPLYVELVAARAAEPARSWFLERIAKLDASSFAAAHAGAGRRLGAQSCELTSAERTALQGTGLLLPEQWPLSAVGRAALLMALCRQLSPAAHEAALVQQFRTGDNAEREAILRSLSLLPEPARFLELAIDACRTHVQSVFEAIACENPYPAALFPEHNFNQLVLKAFFTGVAVKRITGLAARRTPELARMAQAYASERRAAGRSVPDDLELATGASE
jgi:triphosphoribosyl-dephospho-CoA synthetase